MRRESDNLQLYKVLSSHARDQREQHNVRSGCFYAFMFFIPREIRAPWFDHILDDRQRAFAEGRSRLFVAGFTFTQCVILAARCLWEFGWDVLNPFKNRTQR